MKKKRSRRKGAKSPPDPDDAAKQGAEEPSKAKAEELRTAIQSKAEQGQSSLGFLPADEDKIS
jgi:hypothetical protein